MCFYILFAFFKTGQKYSRKFVTFLFQQLNNILHFFQTLLQKNISRKFVTAAKNNDIGWGSKMSASELVNEGNKNGKGEYFVLNAPKGKKPRRRRMSRMSRMIWYEKKTLK